MRRHRVIRGNSPGGRRRLTPNSPAASACRAPATHGAWRGAQRTATCPRQSTPTGWPLPSRGQQLQGDDLRPPPAGIAQTSTSTAEPDLDELPPGEAGRLGAAVPAVLHDRSACRGGREPPPSSPRPASPTDAVAGRRVSVCTGGTRWLRQTRRMSLRRQVDARTGHSYHRRHHPGPRVRRLRPRLPGRTPSASTTMAADVHGIPTSGHRVARARGLARAPSTAPCGSTPPPGPSGIVTSPPASAIFSPSSIAYSSSSLISPSSEARSSVP